MPEDTEPKHRYHAKAHILSGDLELPLIQKIEPQTQATLSEEGGYISEHQADYKLEGVISYRRAYSQVAGNRDKKTGHGHSTVATSVIEGLNILEVVTADRVVGQIFTEHPCDGHTPTVSFLGTRFENLRIAGFPVHLHFRPEMLGPKPENDLSYLYDEKVRHREAAQHARIRGHHDVPQEVLERYNRDLSSSRNEEPIECSLVDGVEGCFPGRSFGHVIDIPHFGRLYLATVRVEHTGSDEASDSKKHTMITLRMIEAKMGCIGHGVVNAGNTVVNGGSKPGG